MTIKFPCPMCGKQLTAPQSLAGQERTCPKCRTRVLVPTTARDALTAAKSAQQASPVSDHPLLLFSSHGPAHGNLIDMTAMVDIVFFLLIFFLVTSMQSLESVVDLPAPESSKSAASVQQTPPDYANDPSVVIVMIDNDDAVWVEDEQSPSDQDLREKLRIALHGEGRERMLIKGAGDATHGKFVTVMDAGADAGMKEILFSLQQSDETADGG